MKHLIIENYQDLFDQFNGVYPELLTTDEIVVQLGLQIASGSEPYVIVDCNKESDAICIFKLTEETTDYIMYEYQGTAS